MPPGLARSSIAALIATLACVTTGPPAFAAPITWGVATDVTGALDVLDTGTLVEAINASGSGASTTVNGVPFVASDLLLDRSFGGDTLSGNTSGDPALDVLLGSFDFGNGTSTSVLVGSGLLLPGERYLIQVFFTDRRSCCSARDMTFGDGLGNTVDVNATGTGLGQTAVGSFVADATSQSLSMATNGFGNAHITGYQIRAVPEPGTALLLSVGLAALGTRRRRTPRPARPLR